MTVKSRISVATNVWRRPSGLTDVRVPLVARTNRREVSIRTVTDRLDGVTNGSPWFGRSNGVRRLTHGNQR